ncbi:DUF1559 domain-containing protein [Schlesneria sp. DSM 10557]|uniref:DUF1559 domain-containing protein n=1 Tax=Schlesneria sp. DSM 10557 TaxID=3044399 RepID=UPI0035A1661F
MFQDVSRGREAGRRTICRNNLKQIALALHKYHDTYFTFPPAYTVDGDGRPLHSWRTLILPYLDQQELYESIDLSKPWNDPVNAAARQTVVSAYKCPFASSKEASTTYLAVVTPTSALRPIDSCRIEDIKDGTSNTVLVVEVPLSESVNWMAPSDSDEGLLQSVWNTAKVSHVGGGHVLFADGSVRLVSINMPFETLQGLITVSGENASVSSKLGWVLAPTVHLLRCPVRITPSSIVSIGRVRTGRVGSTSLSMPTKHRSTPVRNE